MLKQLCSDNDTFCLYYEQNIFISANASVILVTFLNLKRITVLHAIYVLPSIKHCDKMVNGNTFTWLFFYNYSNKMSNFELTLKSEKLRFEDVRKLTFT